MQQSHKTKVLFIVFGLLIVSALSCLAFTAGGTFSVGQGGGGCSSACDPASDEVGSRANATDNGTIAIGGALAALFTPDCSGYLDMAYVFQGNIAAMSGPVKILVYLDDGDSVPDSGDTLIAKTASITGGTASTWYNSAITESCVSVSTENDYWIVAACDDDSAYGFRYGYDALVMGTMYTDTTGDYYDAEPSTLGAGEWGSQTYRTLSTYITID